MSQQLLPEGSHPNDAETQQGRCCCADDASSYVWSDSDDEPGADGSSPISSSFFPQQTGVRGAAGEMAKVRAQPTLSPISFRGYAHMCLFRFAMGTRHSLVEP